MKYLVSLTFRYIESNHETYCILDEEKYNEYKQFFCVDCKPLIESGESFDEEGEYEGTPGITIENGVEDWIVNYYTPEGKFKDLRIIHLRVPPGYRSE